MENSSVTNSAKCANIVSFSTLDSKIQELLIQAKDVRELSYSPYSNFKVGSAILTEDGTIFNGCNVENASFSPSICAEKTAIVKAISSGIKRFTAVAVVAFQENCFTAPCGSCRQVICEFAHFNIPIYISKPDLGNVLITSIEELLPHGFKTLV